MMSARTLLLALALSGCASETINPAPGPDAGGVDATSDKLAPDVVSTDTLAPDVVSTDTLAPDVRDVVSEDVPDAPPDAPPDVPAVDVAPDVACPVAGETRCGGTCRNLATDVNHCGGCGRICPSGVLCSAGSCLADDCPGGRFCSGVCRLINTDRANCGGCGVVCPSGQVCAAGRCACPTGQTLCGGACVDTQFNSTHCGGCSQNCCPGNVCSVGSCFPGCVPGTTACPGSMSSCRGGVCVNLASDPANCGACAARCATGQTCVGARCVGTGFMALEPCTSAGGYNMTNTVRFGGSLGSTYEPRCVTVRAGDVVTWEGSFSGHPLDPSTRGTAMNPITSTSTGTRRSVTFPRTGFYPFYCTFHGTDSGLGMAGVVQVIP